MLTRAVEKFYENGRTYGEFEEEVRGVVEGMGLW